METERRYHSGGELIRRVRTTLNCVENEDFLRRFIMIETVNAEFENSAGEVGYDEKAAGDGMDDRVYHHYICRFKQWDR